MSLDMKYFLLANQAINKVNQNEFNVKLTLAGNNLDIKTYDTIQLRKKALKEKRYDIFYDEKDYFVVDLVTGESIHEDLFDIKLENGDFSKEQVFFYREKIKYMKLSEQEKKLFNKKKSLQRAKNKIKNLINANLPGHKDSIKFLTLTFKENITSVATANDEFKKFMKRLNYYVETNSNTGKIKYLAVLENQKRGAIHYHVLLFNCPYIPFDKYLDIWGLGGVYIESFLNKKTGKSVKINCQDGDFIINDDVTDVVENVGAYVTKTIIYMTKSIDDIITNAENVNTVESIEVIMQENAKIYQCSKDLKKESNYYIVAQLNIFEKFIELIRMYYTRVNEFEYENELMKVNNIQLLYNFDFTEFNQLFMFL